MKYSSFFLAALPVLATQALAAGPVDLAGIRQEATAFETLVTNLPQGVDPWKNPKVKAGLHALLKRLATARGEDKEVRLVVFGNLIFKVGIPGHEAMFGRIAREVPPGSPGWKLGLDLAGWTSDLPGFKGTGYQDRLLSEGVPEARAAVLEAKVTMFLEDASDLAAAKEALGKIHALAPGSQSEDAARKAVEAYERTLPGNPAPAFEVADLENPAARIRLEDFKGKFLLMDFWATWCHFCVQELPTTHRLYGLFHARGLEVLSLSLDQKPKDVLTFRKRPGLGMPWHHGFLPVDAARRNPVLDAFGVSGYPTLFLIGPDGRILAKGMDLREEKLESTLSKFLPAAANVRP